MRSIVCLPAIAEHNVLALLRSSPALRSVDRGSELVEFLSGQLPQFRQAALEARVLSTAQFGQLAKFLSGPRKAAS